MHWSTFHENLILFLLLVPLCVDFAQAQPVGAFHIGLNGFAPEWDPVTHMLHFVEGVATDTTTTDPDTLLHKLTHRQFYRAIELGANLIQPNILPDYLLSSPNVVREICESAVAGSDTLLTMITDWGLLDVLGGERRMVHPEYEGDFSERGDFFLGK